jgi:hypothetical protein
MSQNTKRPNSDGGDSSVMSKKKKQALAHQDGLKTTKKDKTREKLTNFTVTVCIEYDYRRSSFYLQFSRIPYTSSLT